MDINATLIDKGIVLPDAPPPAANYIPYVKIDKLVFVSGQVSQNENGFIKGVLGKDLNVEEGYNAGCWTVGVYRWSSYMNVMSYRESIEVDNIVMGPKNNFNENYSKLFEKKILSKNKLKESKCHFIVPTVGYVPNIVKDINNMDLDMSKKYIA